MLIRYELISPNSLDWVKSGTKAEVRCALPQDGVLTKLFKIASPSRSPLVKIGRARFGHPLGGKNGRGAFDVTEFIQVCVNICACLLVVLYIFESFFFSFSGAFDLMCRKCFPFFLKLSFINLFIIYFIMTAHI
jgi:hypothetical protein